jgi:hypothetical protein
MPKTARHTMKLVKLGAKPDNTSITEKKTRFTIIGRRRPYRSAAKPKITAPMGRNTKVIVMAKVILLSDT